MLDTFNIFNRGNFLDYKGDARQQIQFCESTGEITNWTGQLRNIVFKSNSFGLSVSGSMPMYLYGTNFREITDCTEIKTGLDEISNYLNLSVLDWTLTRFDFPINIELSHLVKDYLHLYADHPTMQPATDFRRHGSQIRYVDSSGWLSIYDKIAQCQVKSIPLPSEYEHANIGRAERAFSRKYLQADQRATASGLLDPAFFSNAATRFAHDFFGIRRIKSLSPQTERLPSNTRELNSLLMTAGVELLDYANVQSLIETSKGLGFATSNAAYRMKKQLRTVADEPGFHFGNELTEEFDTKMRERFRQWGVDEKILSI